MGSAVQPTAATGTTAPTSSFAPRQFAGQRRQTPASPGGDGAAAATTALQQPGQRPAPGPQTGHPPAAQPNGATQSFAQMQAAGIARPGPQQVQASAAPVAQTPVTPPASAAPTQPQTAAPSTYNYGGNGLGGQLTSQSQNGGATTGPGGAPLPAGNPEMGSFAGDLDRIRAANGWNPAKPTNNGYPDGVDVAALFQGVNQATLDPNQITQASPPSQNGVPTPGSGYPSGAPSTSQSGTGAPTSGGIGGDLQGAVSSALQNPSRYGLPQVQQVRDALTAQLQQQFSGQQKQLDEEMARRGVGASSIAAGYNGDLAGQQDTALANMNASLIQNAASTNAADQTAAWGAGQNLLNSQNQSSQFGQSLAQQLQTAIMSDKTANRGVDAQSALANNALWAQLATSLGLTPGSLTAAGSTGQAAGTTGGGVPAGSTGADGVTGGSPANPIAPSPYTNTSSSLTPQQQLLLYGQRGY